MANPALNDKKFEEIREEWMPGFAAPDSASTGTAAQGGGGLHPAGPPAGRRHDRQRHLRQDGDAVRARARRRRLRLVADHDLAHRRPSDPRAGRGSACSSAFGLAIALLFKPKLSPILGPLYALVEGVFLGVISKAFESQWNGIVFQAILAVIGVFIATLALYVFGVVKVTKKFQMVVIGATVGIFLLYLAGMLLSLFGVDVVFWNDPIADRHRHQRRDLLRRRAEPVPRLRVHPPEQRLAGAPKYMEWFGAFGLMVTLVWLYLEVLRLLSLLRQ